MVWLVVRLPTVLRKRNFTVIYQKQRVIVFSMFISHLLAQKPVNGQYEWH